MDSKIREYFKIREGGNLPYTGHWQTSRKTLYKFMGRQKLKLGAEIGVCKGINANDMFRYIPDLKLYCVDLWDVYHAVLEKEQAEAHYQEALRRLEGKNAVFIKKKSLDAVNDFPNHSLDFVYIDGDHTFDAVMMDIINWVPKVKRGGIVAGHDYYEFPKSGVVKAVQAYTTGHNIQNWYLTRLEKEHTWFWVNKNA